MEPNPKIYNKRYLNSSYTDINNQAYKTESNIEQILGMIKLMIRNKIKINFVKQNINNIENNKYNKLYNSINYTSIIYILSNQNQQTIYSSDKFS